MPWLRRRLNLPTNQVFDPLVHELPGQIQTVALDPAATFTRPLPLVASTDTSALKFFSARKLDVTTRSYVSAIQGGVAWGHPTGGVFTADGQFIPAFTHDPCGPTFHSVWTRLYLPQPRRLAGRVLYLVTPEATDNYHHWLIDLLPRIGLVRRAGYRIQDFDHVVVNHSGRRYQLETLAHLGIPAEKIIRADASLFVRADLLVVPSMKGSNQTLPAADVTFLREAFVGSAPEVAPKRRIFLSRQDAGSRRLRNETDFHDVLQSLDFEIITPGGMDVVAQARLFAEAEVIAGPAGAAFANLVFASPGARVVEIAPPQWLATFHWMVSSRVGLEHTLVLGDGEIMSGIPDSSARRHDLVVQPAKLIPALERAAGAIRTKVTSLP